MATWLLTMYPCSGYIVRMRNEVAVSKRALKQLQKAPKQVGSKLKAWAEAVETDGLREVRKSPGFHDEPLKGRRRGQRAIRLTRKWRAVYTTTEHGDVQIVTVEEVTPHDY